MSAASRMPRLFTAEEYLLIERGAAYKSEFIGGEIIAMAGASENHITINFNLGPAIGPSLRGTSCRGFGNDMKVRTTPEGLFAYPDLVIVCGERQYHDAKRDVLLNPTALFEILSPSTAAFDRGEKFLLYQELESLRDYVLISQDTPRIEHYARQENNLWFPTVAIGLGSALTLSAVPVTLRLADVYENINFAP
jgi:Uma2 family endonuclease